MDAAECCAAAAWIGDARPRPAWWGGPELQIDLLKENKSDMNNDRTMITYGRLETNIG